jgi:hypothetical protein
MRIPISRQFAVLAFLTFLILAPLVGCESSLDSPQALSFLRPGDDQLSLAGDVQVRLQVPPAVTADDLVVALDGTPVEIALRPDNGDVIGVLSGVEAGDHALSVETLGDGGSRRADVRFETIALHNPDECEILNDAECLLPYPSSRFLAEADTPTGYRLAFPRAGMPVQNGAPLDPAPYAELDGFNPFVPILMHFPAGVDVAASNAPRLLAERRTYDGRSLDPDSPTVLLDADTGERIVHFIEQDARATDLERRVTFLHPGRSLTPGHRYIVAVRNLLDPSGAPVTADAVFAALRDGRLTDIASLETRREHFEQLFTRLAAEGIERENLILAFDFVVRSDQGLTGDLVSMRDQAFAWLAEQGEAKAQTFSIENVRECSDPQTAGWKRIEGTFQVPLFLDLDPILDPLSAGTITIDSEGVPVWSQLMNAPFAVAIPCGALAAGSAPLPPLLGGHGGFDAGQTLLDFIIGLENADSLDRFVLGATDWLGFSSRDFEFSLLSLQDPNLAKVLGDRTMQGQVNTLVFARMLQQGLFNRDAAFQSSNGNGVLAGASEEMFFVGASSGGGLGLAFAALSPDFERAWIETPHLFPIHFQRTVFYYELFFQRPVVPGIGDSLDVALLLSVSAEQSIRGQAASFATHVTRDPLPGSNAKKVLLTLAWLDQYAANIGGEAMARTLGLPSIVGSRLSGLVQIPDLEGPLPSALVINDYGRFDLANPAHEPFIPPLANLEPVCSACDPHIPSPIDVGSARQQILGFFQPGGEIENFCNGICDAGDPTELPPVGCDPLAPPPDICDLVNG